MSLSDRIVSALLTGIVADAAAMPIHWIYDVNKLLKAKDEYGSLAFLEKSMNPYYLLPTGSNTFYGVQYLILLESLVENQSFQPEDYINRLVKTFGRDTLYETPQSKLYWIKKLNQEGLPLKGPWRNIAIERLLTNIEKGITYPHFECEDDQIDSCVTIFPLVCLLAGKEDLLEKVEDLVKITHANSVALSFALASARIFEGCLLGMTAEEAIRNCAKQLRNPKRKCPQEFDRAVAVKIEEMIRKRDKDHSKIVQNIGRT